jgi:Zn-dependent protease
MTTTTLGDRARRLDASRAPAEDPPRLRLEHPGGLFIGRVRGIAIRLDWSLIVVFFLIAMNLAVGHFPAQHPAWSPALSWTVALLAAILFFASVLAHELAHALVGRRQGVRVDAITLFMFGGMAQMRDEPRSPKAELLMAIVGPITSFVIGIAAVLLGVAVLARTAGGEGPSAWLPPAAPAATLLLWLGPINLLLAGFNIIPAFPLDGGRVLRAILWRASGDLVKATRWASGVGRAFALLLVFAGVLMLFGRPVPVLGAGLIPGLWTVFIGWFLNAAAIASYHQLLLRRTLEGVPVQRLMRNVGTIVPANASIEEVVDRFLQSPSERCLLVADEGRVVGIACMADLAKVPREEWKRRAAAEIMTPLASLAVATPSEDVATALSKLAAADVDQLPVVEKGEVRGVLRRADVIRWMELHGAPA